jgi:predicted outer membrane repeat protein
MWPPLPSTITLYAFGFGPFSIVDNHLSCGGTVEAKTFEFAPTVAILNMGLAIEVASILSFSQLNNSATTAGLANFSRQPSLPSGGTVVFTNNICQLEGGAIRLRASVASVAILSLDTVLFSNNQCWADGTLAAIIDAFVLGFSVQVASNRFQETLLPLAVVFSGVTIGLLNITAQNISTLCLLPFGGPSSM